MKIQTRGDIFCSKTRQESEGLDSPTFMQPASQAPAGLVPLWRAYAAWPCTPADLPPPIPWPLLWLPAPAPPTGAQTSAGKGAQLPSSTGVDTHAPWPGPQGTDPHPALRGLGRRFHVPTRALAADCSDAHLGNITINPTAGFQISDCDGDCWRENRQLSAVSFT
jgi:hypothetical protein